MHVKIKVQQGVGTQLLYDQANTRIRGRITVLMDSILTGLDSVVSIHTNSNILSCLVKSNPVKLQTSRI